jgi:hypothetical protein
MLALVWQNKLLLSVVNKLCVLNLSHFFLNAGIELHNEVSRSPIDQTRNFIKVRADLGVPRLRPVQLGHIQSRPPPLIRIKPDSPVPSPPRLAGSPRPGLIQLRPVGSPGNLSGFVNIIPRQNGSGPKVLPGIPSPLSSPSGQPLIRPLNRSLLSPTSSADASKTSPTGSVLGIKNLTPLDTGMSPRLPNFRPIQVTPIRFHKKVKLRF